LFAVAFVDRVIERLPVGRFDPLALAVGELRVQVPGAVNAVALGSVTRSV
jgi:hypothetical protein